MKTLPLGLLTLLATTILLTGCGEQIAPVSAGTATVPVASAQGRSGYTAFGDSITCGYVAAGATTAAPYSIGDASCHTANAFPSYMASATSLPLQNDSIPGDQACDIWARQIAPQGVSPTLATAPLYTVLIGTNDANAKGTGAYEADFTGCNLATLTWLALPLENKVLASAAASNGWALGSQSAFGTYAISAQPGATLSFAITTSGGPLYLWHTVSDSDAGTATFALDGLLLRSFSTRPSTPVATQNGTTATVIAERIPSVPAGAHTLVITDTSGTVAVLGIGTPAAKRAAGNPIVLVGSIPLPLQGAGDYLLPAIAAYTADTLSLVTMLQADGLDTRYAPNHQYMTGSPGELTDLIHVSPLGAAHLAEAFLAVGP